MNKLQTEYKLINNKLKNFNSLQNCRNMDFPNNLDKVCKINFNSYFGYYRKTIENNNLYNPKFDYNLITLIYNYVTSVKSYLNRKKRYIEKKVYSKNKGDVLIIFEKYWKTNRYTTNFDKLVAIRDLMEHENLLNGFSLNRAYYKDYVDTKLMYQLNLKNTSIDVDVNALFILSQKNINDMNTEITNYVNDTLHKLNLRDCSLFLNAFYRKFKNENFTQLFPEETIEEMKIYDKIIEDLNNS